MHRSRRYKTLPRVHRLPFADWQTLDCPAWPEQGRGEFTVLGRSPALYCGRGGMGEGSESPDTPANREQEKGEA